MFECPTILKMAPPPQAARILRRFPGGATFNIVGLNHLSDVHVRVSNNIENGTSAGRDSYPHARQSPPP
jgi:hypothetical protein